MRNTVTDFRDLFYCVDNELVLNRTDSTHDFLVYLAEQMIEMNKKKNEEIKGFLKWLEPETGVKIDNLANKTTIREKKMKKNIKRQITISYLSVPLLWILKNL